MLRLTYLHFGNQFEYVYDPPEPVVAAIDSNDEFFIDTLSGPAGQQAADLLQGMAKFDGKKIIGHQFRNRFAGQQIGSEWLEQGF